MPVVLEQFSDPAALGTAERSDLERLRADHPEPGAGPEARWGSGQWLVAGRFNGRLLAAAWLVRDGENWRLLDLCVRAMTRRRGVARQLLTLLTRDAERAGHPLVMTVDDTAPLAGLLRELQFERDHAGDWSRPRRG